MRSSPFWLKSSTPESIAKVGAPGGVFADLEWNRVWLQPSGTFNMLAMCLGGGCRLPAAEASPSADPGKLPAAAGEAHGVSIIL